MTTKKVKVLISAKVSIVKAKKILNVVDEEVEDIYNKMSYAEIVYCSKDIIVWDKGYSLNREDIINAYISDSFLFIDKSDWMMVFVIE